MTSMYLMCTAREDNVTECEEWFADYLRNTRCPRCSLFNRAWRASPAPIDLEVETDPTDLICYPEQVFINLVHTDLFEFIKPYAGGVLAGKVSVREDGGLRPCEYVSLVAPPALQLDVHRGPMGQHEMCSGCGKLATRFYCDGVVRHHLDKRHFYISHNMSFYVTDYLRTKIRDAFGWADLRFARTKVIDAPLDGDVLPGDPGWDGTFRPQVERLKGRV
jgi:hypothetical protein